MKSLVCTPGFNCGLPLSLTNVTEPLRLFPKGLSHHLSLVANYTADHFSSYIDGAMGSGCEPSGNLRNKEILEETKMQQIAMVTRRRKLQWFGAYRDERKHITSEQLPR